MPKEQECSRGLLVELKISEPSSGTRGDLANTCMQGLSKKKFGYLKRAKRLAT